MLRPPSSYRECGDTTQSEEEYRYGRSRGRLVGPSMVETSTLSYRVLERATSRRQRRATALPAGSTHVF